MTLCGVLVVGGDIDSERLGLVSRASRCIGLKLAAAWALGLVLPRAPPGSRGLLRSVLDLTRCWFDLNCFVFLGR